MRLPKESTPKGMRGFCEFRFRISAAQFNGAVKFRLGIRLKVEFVCLIQSFVHLSNVHESNILCEAKCR